SILAGEGINVKFANLDASAYDLTAEDRLQAELQKTVKAMFGSATEKFQQLEKRRAVALLPLPMVFSTLLVLPAFLLVVVTMLMVMLVSTDQK
ncbi:unnamed protein product, partial [Prorocentrum cordatum]